MKIQITSTKKSCEVEIVAAISPAKPRADVGPKAGDITVVTPDGRSRSGGSTRLVVSLGPKRELSADSVRRAGGAAGKWLARGVARSAAADLSALDELKIDDAAIAFVEGLALGSFQFSRHRARNAGQAQRSKPASVYLLEGKQRKKQAAAIRRALRVCESVNLARDWGHEPANVINPITLAARIKKLAHASKLKCTVLDDKKLSAMKANAIVQVGIGSKTPSRLIILEHRSADIARGAKPVVLVGKAITFDTGGYSLKDKNGIVGMKYDKCGGMAVVGAMQAVAALKLKTPVVGVIAAAENMISESAYRPNDIVKTLSGKTVEIISTDAEGRMVLADALTYAGRKYKPKVMIDLATLTGGVIVALGKVRAGLMCNDDKLADALLDCGEHVHERLWRLPLDDEYLELISGDDSDIKNSGGREAHPIQGGIFLKQFVPDGISWAHLDIAGPAITDSDLPYCPKGATGFGVRLLIEYLRRPS